MRYRIFGATIESSRPLPELPAARLSDRTWCSIAWPHRVRFPAGLAWGRVWPDVSFARSAGGAFLRFDGVASVRIASGVVEIAGEADVDAAMVRHALVDQILPLVLAAAGETVLHASAVDVGGSAVLFIGGAGAGKSTMAAALAGCGAQVLTDDSVLLQMRGADVAAVPSYAGLRLRRDVADLFRVPGYAAMRLGGRWHKRRFVPREPQPIGAVRPVSHVYALHAGSDASGFTRLSRRDAALELVRHMFTPDVADRAGLLAHLDRAACWSGRVEMWSLGVRHDLSQLEPLARAVLAHVESHQASVQ